MFSLVEIRFCKFKFEVKICLFQLNGQAVLEMKTKEYQDLQLKRPNIWSQHEVSVIRGLNDYV